MWGTPNVEGTDPFCAASKHVAYELTQGSPTCPNSYTAADLGSASLYVYFGENQAEARPVYFGMINDWRITNGARMVVVDPRYTVTATRPTAGCRSAAEPTSRSRSRSRTTSFQMIFRTRRFARSTSRGGSAGATSFSRAVIRPNGRSR